MAEFEIFGLDDLKKDLQKCITEYPDETDKAIRKFANQWVKECNEKMPAAYSSGKRAIPKSWKKKVERTLGVSTEIQIRNQAPHFHLVENGHKKFINGVNTGGYVPGKHYAEKTRAAWEDSYPEKVEEFVDEMLKGNSL